jgi:nucleoside-diphosphate-sugar epimerase
MIGNLLYYPLNNITMRSVLVTGHSGFIGSNLCHKLVSAGHDVHGVDIRSPDFDLPPSVQTQVDDLTNSPKLPEVDVIVHLAAHSQVQPIVDSPELALENIEMTQHVLSEASRMGAHVINASSRDVYGSDIQPPEETATPNSPNGYAASKIGSEAITNAYKHTQNLDVTNLRLSNVYGPRDLNERVIPIFISLADRGEELTVYGNGKLLDFVFVDDVCDAIISSIQRRRIVNGKTLNIGAGRGIPLSKLASLIVEHIDSCPGWNRSDERVGDVSSYVSDISKARALLNFEPKVQFNDGMSKTIEWYLDNRDILSTIAN